MDAIDRANDLAQMHLDAALSYTSVAVKQQTDDCQECGLSISSARQNATGGTDMCAECADYFERRRKFWR